jgi:hypothetical protein
VAGATSTCSANLAASSRPDQHRRSGCDSETDAGSPAPASGSARRSTARFPYVRRREAAHHVGRVGVPRRQFTGLRPLATATHHQAATWLLQRSRVCQRVSWPGSSTRPRNGVAADPPQHRHTAGRPRAVA